MEPAVGKILIDGKDITHYRLQDLRAGITVIEQDPTLITGTFRENLDPAGLYSEEEVRQIAKECYLEDIINEKGGLDSVISNDSLSVG